MGHPAAHSWQGRPLFSTGDLRGFVRKIVGRARSVALHLFLCSCRKFLHPSSTPTDFKVRMNYLQT